MKLWGDKSSWTYSSLGYVFLTSNSTLAYISRRFTSEFWWDGKNHKSPCISDYYLGTMIWLSTPSQTVENFSKLKLLADCSAATTLSREVMDKFLVELKRLSDTTEISDNDYLLIRTKAFENNYLQNVTLNEESAFRVDTIEQLLEDIKSDIKKPLKEEMAERDKTIAYLQADNSEMQSRIISMEDEAKRKEQAEKEHDLELAEKGKKSARTIVHFISPIIIAVFTFAFVVLQMFVSSSTIIMILKIIAALLSLSSTIFFALMKVNYRGAYESLEKRMIKRFKVQDYEKKI